MSRLRRFLNLWRERSLHREFDDELQFHQDMRITSNLRAGMTREDAEREAKRHVGSTLRATEGMREARLMGWVESIGRDLRHGWRLLRRQPALTALVVLTLSLGIGANATIFSLLNAVLFRPLPFPDPDRLVAIVDNYRTTGVSGTGPTVPELIDARNWTRELEQVSFFDARDFQINGGLEPERVFAARVEASFFDVLGVRASIGRTFADGENLQGRDRVVVLSNALWRRNFNADPQIVGSQIVLNGGPATVIGILPPQFTFDYLVSEPIEMYVPFPMNDLYTSRTAEFANVRRVTAVARLKAGHEIHSAAAEMQALSQTLAAKHPELYRRGSDGQDVGFFMSVVPLRQVLTWGSRPVLILLFTAVALVLLIACVNTAQFLLARSTDREPEMTLRTALGASRARLFGQSLAEAAFLGGLAAVAGLLQVFWLSKIFVAMFPDGTPFIADVGIDRWVLVFTLSVGIGAAIASSLLPAILFSRPGLGLQLAGRGLVAGRARSRHALIVIEVAVSIVLLVSTGSLVQSLLTLHNAPSGYSSENVTTLRMRLQTERTSSSSPTFLQNIAAITGVEAAALADAPLPGFADTEFSIEGRGNDAATLSRQLATYRIVSPAYFSVLRIPLLQGRVFSNEDSADRQPVAVINEEMARRFWPGENAIEQRIRSGPGPRSAVMTIVGVVGNTRPLLQMEAVPQIYASYRQQTEPNATLLIRSGAGNPLPLDAVKAAVRSVLPNQPLFSVRPLAEVVSQSVARQRAVAQLLGAFALLALFMSTCGIYTVVTYATSRRAREIALRLALGAKARNVLALVAQQTFLSAIVGLLLGIFGAIAASNALRATLVGMEALEALTVVLVGLLYLVVVAFAIYVPASRALGMNPATTLKVE